MIFAAIVSIARIPDIAKQMAMNFLVFSDLIFNRFDKILLIIQVFAKWFCEKTRNFWFFFWKTDTKKRGYLLGG